MTRGFTLLLNTGRFRFILTIVLLIYSLTFAASLFAQTSTESISDDDVNAIAEKLYCPICESTPLDVCPTQACADWREVIRIKLGEGESEEEIKEYFEIQYGARALAQPPASGFTLAVWILPLVAIVVGGFLFSRYMRRIRSSDTSKRRELPQQPVDQAQPSQDDYETRIEQELEDKTT